MKKPKKYYRKNKLSLEELLVIKKSVVVGYRRVGFKNSQRLNLMMLNQFVRDKAENKENFKFQIKA